MQAPNRFWSSRAKMILCAERFDRELSARPVIEPKARRRPRGRAQMTLFGDVRGRRPFGRDSNAIMMEENAPWQKN